MPIYALDDLEPTIDPTAFVHPDAVIIGNVHLGPESSVWPGAVLRGDSGGIFIGARTSIQDGAVLHTTWENPTTVGSDCVIGHLVHLEGCRIEDACLVGSGAIVMEGAVLGTGSLVGAGALVVGGMQVPAGAMALGVPAKIKEGAARPEQILPGAAHYAERARKYPTAMRRLDNPPPPPRPPRND